MVVDSSLLVVGDKKSSSRALLHEIEFFPFSFSNLFVFAVFTYNLLGRAEHSDH